MKRTFTSIAATSIAAVLALALPSFAYAAAEDAVGTWKDSETGGITQIYNCEGGICVKVVTPSKGRERDDSNPDPTLKGRPMAGVTIMTGAAKDGASGWKGKLYNSEDGKVYSGYIEVKSKDEVKLEGCILGGIFCKSHIWRRAQ